MGIEPGLTAYQGSTLPAGLLLQFPPHPPAPQSPFLLSLRTRLWEACPHFLLCPDVPDSFCSSRHALPNRNTTPTSFQGRDLPACLPIPLGAAAPVTSPGDLLTPTTAARPDFSEGQTRFLGCREIILREQGCFLVWEPQDIWLRANLGLSCAVAFPGCSVIWGQKPALSGPQFTQLPK